MIVEISKKYLFLIVTVLFFSCEQATNNEGPTPPIVFDEIISTDVDNAVVKPDGSVWTWGSNSTGQLANGNLLANYNPALALNLKNIVAVELKRGHGFAADIDGNIWYWGRAYKNPPADTAILPVKIALLPGTKQIDLTDNDDLFLLDEKGSVWQLKIGWSNPEKYIYPEKVNELDNIIMISGIYAVKKDGTLMAFPNYDWLEPELGGPGSETVTDVISVKNHYPSTLILKKDGTVWIWGRVYSVYPGDSTIYSSDTPLKIDNLDSVISISYYGTRCMALTKDGSVYYWGNLYFNRKVLYPYEKDPVKIEGLENIKQIDCGQSDIAIFLDNDGKIWEFNWSDQSLTKLNIKN